MMRTDRKTLEAETADRIRARITSNVDQFLMDLSTKYFSMERRGRKHLWRSLGEAAVFIAMAQNDPSITDNIPLDENRSKNSTSSIDNDATKKVVYHMMKPEGKQQISMASKYITTIRYLISEGVDGDEFVDAIKAIGGIEEACKKSRAKIQGSIETKVEKDRNENSRSINLSRNGFPKITKKWLESHVHIDMGGDTERLCQPGTYILKVRVDESGESYKPISGQIVKIEE